MLVAGTQIERSRKPCPGFQSGRGRGRGSGPECRIRIQVTTAFYTDIPTDIRSYSPIN